MPLDRYKNFADPLEPSPADQPDLSGTPSTTGGASPSELAPRMGDAALMAGGQGVRALPLAAGAGLAGAVAGPVLGLGALPVALAEGAGALGTDRALGQSWPQSIMDTLFQLGAGPAGKVVQAGTKSVTEGLGARALNKAVGGKLADNLAEGGADALAAAEKLGVKVPPHVVTEGADRSAAVRDLVGMSDRASQDLNVDIQRRATQSLEQRAYALTGGQGMTREQALQLGGDALRTGYKVNKNAAQLGFESVDKSMASPGAPTIKTTALTQHIRSLMERESISTPPPEWKRILDLPTDITFGDAQRVRSELFDIANPPDKPYSTTQTVSQKDATVAGDALSASMDEALNQVPLARGTIDAARSLWSSEVKGRFAQRQFLDIMQKDPRNILNYYRSLEPGVAEDVMGTMEKYLPGSAEKVRGAILQDVINDARPIGMPFGEGTPDPNKLLAGVGQFKDPAIARSLFPPGTESRNVLENARQIGQLMRLSRDRLGKGMVEEAGAMRQFGSYAKHHMLLDIAKSGVKGGIGGAAIGAATGSVEGALASGLVLGGVTLYNALKHKTLTNWLKVAVTSDVGSRTAARAIVGLLTPMIDTGLVPPDELPAAQRQLEAARKLVPGIKDNVRIQQGERVEVPAPSLAQVRLQQAANKGATQP